MGPSRKFTMNTNLTRLFKFLCFSATIFMITFWSIEYLKDNDLASVDYKSIKKVDFTYPILSLCFEKPFLEEKLTSIDPNLNKSRYVELLRGNADDHGLLKKINYSNVTLNMEKSLEHYYILWKNSSGYTKYPASNKNLVRPIVTYNGFLNRHFKKCFSFELEPDIMKNVRRVKRVYDANIFREYPQMKRPMTGAFSAVVHYPDQFLLRLHTEKLGWKERNDTKPYFMHFKVQMIEYYRRRNKRSKSCIPNKTKFDAFVLSNHSKFYGCRATYDSMNSNLSVCEGMDNIRKTLFDGKGIDLDQFDHPCDSILDVTLEYDEFNEGDKSIQDNEIVIGITFPDRVKVIQQSKEISFHALVGNSGGYIGLFLGK